MTETDAQKTTATVINVVSDVASVASTILTVVGFFVPFVGIGALILKYLPYICKGLPILGAIVAHGPDALAEAKAADPELFGGLTSFLSEFKGAQADDHDLAALGAHVAGIDPPGWVHSDTVAWWARAQGNEA